MANLVFLKGFNNYFNRKIITKNSLQEYYDAVEDYIKIDNINFNPNDGVTTELIVNWSAEWNPDYLLVLKTIDNEEKLESSWFIMEAERTRNSQYKVTLKRDTIGDYKSEIINSPMFIEKATLNPSDPMIYNSEGMDFNQIKKSETLLKDSTNMAWIVGYTTQDNVRHPENGYYEGTSELKTIITSSNIPTWVKNSFGQTLKFANEDDINNKSINAKYQVRTNKVTFGIRVYGIEDLRIFDINNSSTTYDFNTSGFDGWSTTTTLNFEFKFFQALFNINNITEYSIEKAMPIVNALLDSFSKLESSRKISLISSLRDDLGIRSYTNYKELMLLNGLVYRDGNNYYKIHVDGSSNGVSSYSYAANSNKQALLDFSTGMLINSDPDHHDGTYTYELDTTSPNKALELSMEYKSVYVWREQVYSGYVEQTLGVLEDATVRTYLPQNRKHLLNQPYDMFCIPYGEMTVNLSSGSFNTIKDIAMLAGRTIAKAGIGEDGLVYDVQLLPYCPVIDIINANGSVSVSNLVENKDYQFITDQYDNKLSIMFWCRSSDFTFNINSDFEIDSNNPIEMKISNECDLYRLCSPNYQGLFDFSLAKNNGYVDFFNVDCSYKPFNPYIHINPNFHGIYGQDFDDSRGLICQGDFSIAVVTDRWAQYELQNKNYQQIFNTKIGTLDAFKDVAKTNLTVNTLNDVFNNNAAATFQGAMTGGTAGAIVKGVQTTINSAVGYGLGTYNINETNRITKNQMISNFNYTLGNIKALPNSLTKSSAFTYNNKVFPFVEYYTCTDKEKQMLRDKLKYDGMTVMATGKISDYLRAEPSFIRGQLIRCEDISDDNHILEDIYNELKKGVYI